MDHHARRTMREVRRIKKKVVYGLFVVACLIISGLGQTSEVTASNQVTTNGALTLFGNSSGDEETKDKSEGEFPWTGDNVYEVVQIIGLLVLVGVVLVFLGRKTKRRGESE